MVSSLGTEKYQTSLGTEDARNCSLNSFNSVKFTLKIDCEIIHVYSQSVQFSYLFLLFSIELQHQTYIIHDLL